MRCLNQRGAKRLGEALRLALARLGMECFKARERLVNRHGPLPDESGKFLFNGLGIQNRFVTHN